MLIDVAREVVLNPTWTVPRTIFVKDKLSKLRETSGGYALDLHARVYSDINGQEVDPYSIDWNQDPSRLPYTLVQSPGPWNALGRIKFPLTNDYAIYLHDTNERNLFIESDRLRSSGCVRLQKPFDLGAKLLAGTNWTVDSLMAATELAPVQAEKPTSLSLKRNVPVYLAYKTLTKSGNKLISSNDPYAIDAAMYSVMFSGK
jgi:murein L,D-transpeptidase YcbB/YkuD